MMNDTSLAERVRAGVPVILIHLLIGYVLLRGLDYVPPTPLEDVLKVVQLPTEEIPPPIPEPPPPPEPAAGPLRPERIADPREEGAASPPNIESRPTPVVAPEPIIRLPIPPPMPAAPVAGTGRQATAGAAPNRGPGTGSGGVGSGFGSGRGGSGFGGGGGGGGGAGSGRLRPPRWVRGTMGPRDLPDELQEYGSGGVVETRYAVEPNGRVTDCRVTRSSGDRRLDAITCRLVEQRFLYDPARDPAGRPFRSFIVQDHYWEFEDLPPEPRRGRRRGW